MTDAELKKVYFDMKEAEEKLESLGNKLKQSSSFIGFVWKQRGDEVIGASTIMKGWRMLLEGVVFHEEQSSD